MNCHSAADAGFALTTATPQPYSEMPPLLQTSPNLPYSQDQQSSSCGQPTLSYQDPDTPSFPEPTPSCGPPSGPAADSRKSAAANRGRDVTFPEDCHSTTSSNPQTIQTQQSQHQTIHGDRQSSPALRRSIRPDIMTPYGNRRDNPQHSSSHHQQQMHSAPPASLNFNYKNQTSPASHVSSQPQHKQYVPPPTAAASANPGGMPVTTTNPPSSVPSGNTPLQPQRQQFRQSSVPHSTDFQSPHSSPPVGSAVTVELTTGEKIKSELFLADNDLLQCIVLRETSTESARRATFHVIQMRAVQNIILHSIPIVPYDTRLPACEFRVLEERERHAIEEFNSVRSLIGINVTKEAQDLFDFIHSTHPSCLWADNGDIKVMNDVTVLHPDYTTCVGPEGPVLERIQDVVNKFRERIQQLKHHNRLSSTKHMYSKSTSDCPNALPCPSPSGSEPVLPE